ncbi:F-BAR domain only protein 2 isoform X5 [Glossina fuscipes]|uniref:F-BAR domain only protein 2 isoform X5 n=1 Tax=Glossina fuscipes TaxID=7396 RepID=A0A9C5ZJR5_9MUSC|nr:F-BAR domain only protein 2 isoform X5 [Glossina fuscipes]
MTVDFNDYFWGEKNNGFDVLYHNMKYGLVASKELSEFFREKSNIEEQNSKLMSKLAHKASTGTLNSTFAPVWTILRTSAEKLSTLHMQMVQKLTELVKDVAKYADELHKKHKSVKEEESQTLDCVKAIQSSTTEVQKARDLYSNKVLELEKLRKDSASQKDIEKLETKLRKLQEDYKVLLEKHNPIKNEFERRMTQTCKRFQEIEEVHLRQMKEFLSTYLELLQNNHDMVGQVHSDFKRQFLDMTVDKLLEQFVLNKYTGLEKPEMPELEFIPLSINQQLSATSATRLNQPNTASISSATNSNSATSINRAGAISMDQRGLEASSLGSTASGSVGLVNNDDTIVASSAKITASAITSTSRPTSPELAPASAAGNAAATSSNSSTATATTVKSNFLNWFSSNIPSKSHQQQQHSVGLNATATTSASGNFGMASNGTNNNSISTSTTTTTTTSTSTTNTTTKTTTTGTTIKNPLNSELQSLQDNNNQGSFMFPTTTTASTATAATSLLPNISAIGTNTKKMTERCIATSTTNHHFSPQNTTTSSTSASLGGGTSSQRRTTSLLNIFSSNSQVSGILRSRRDKAKTKKSKKKKDGDLGDNIQEERTQSVDRLNSGLDYDDHNRIKSQSTVGSSAIGLALTSTTGSSSGITIGNVDSSGSTVINATAISSTTNITNNNATTNICDILINSSASGGGSGGGDALITKANSSGVTINATTVSNNFKGNEVDEDGYSLQPPKEIAWEENHENAGSFYSDSDSDSDNDKPERRIHVKIKPLNNGQAPMSASVDELRATVENISLSPTGVFSHHSQQLQQPSRLTSRQQSPEISNASTPTATVHPYAPLQSPTLSMSNNSRYADLGDIFSELGDVSISAPASANLTKTQSRQIPTPTSGTGTGTNSSIAIPRPPSRRSEMVVAGARGRISPAPINAMNRADSIGSLEFRTAIGGIGSSRGPSPLTIGISDTIPLAVAFHEIIHAYFRGSDESRCQVKISGDMMLSFPAGIAGLLANNPNPNKLGFRIKNVQNLDNFIPNSKLVQVDKNQSSSFSTMLEFNMPALTALLRRQAEHNPTASYFNVDILKYQVRTKPGASSCPFQLVSYWKCEPTFTALKIDYKYNNHAMASACPLLNVTLSVPVNGSVRNVQSKPHSAWLGESNRLVWNFTDISQNSPDGGVGTLRARLELGDGPSTPALLSTQFNCEGTTLSGIEFELQGSGYRLSLVKRRFVSGKYVCEGDGIRSTTTPTPPSVGSSSPFSAKSN